MIKIAIDGPGGAGKSTVAKAVAARLGIVYVDTGALYRTIGYYVRGKNIDPKDRVAVSACLPEIKIEVKYENGAQHVYLNGEDVSGFIRTNDVSMAASAVSAIPAVRDFLLSAQRNVAKTQNVIMDGRDIGTVIFPDAQVKIFLTAGSEARAIRRCEELRAKGQDVTLEYVKETMAARDANDSGREVAPAIPAEDAVFLDNSDFAPEDTLAAAMEIISSKIDVSAFGL